jgi:hypothetical protein
VLFDRALATGQLIDRNSMEHIMFGFSHLLPDIPKQQFLFGKMPVEGRVSMDGRMKHRPI